MTLAYYPKCRICGKTQVTPAAEIEDVYYGDDKENGMVQGRFYHTSLKQSNIEPKNRKKIRLTALNIALVQGLWPDTIPNPITHPGTPMADSEAPNLCLRCLKNTLVAILDDEIRYQDGLEKLIG